MTISALLFGAIGTLTETSDMQRRAFNMAFEDAGLDWHWSWDDYAPMLRRSGGQNRIEAYAAEMDETVDAIALHAAKVAHFDRLLQEEGLKLRAGVRNLINAAHDEGIPVGFVTSTGADQSQAIIDALGDDLSRDDFAYIGDRSRVSDSKPYPAIYLDALSVLGVTAADVVAIEDTPDSADAAVAAGITTMAYVGQAAQGQQFPTGVMVVDVLSPELLHVDAVAA